MGSTTTRITTISTTTTSVFQFPTPNATKGCECGKRTENKRTKHKKGRIIGGENSNNDGWLALLYFEDASTPHYSCAGTVINNKYILTVLHCVVKDPTANI